MEGVHESIKVVEAGYGMAIAPAVSVKEKLVQGSLARVFVDQVEISQSLFICTRKADQNEYPLIHFLKRKLGDLEI